MKKLFLFVLILLLPAISFATWTDAQLKAKLDVPTASGYLSCHKDTDGTFYSYGNAYNTNANWNTSAGQNNVKTTFFATTNIYTNSRGWRESKGATTIRLYKNITFQFVYGGVTYNYSLPAGTYTSATPPTSYRMMYGEAFALTPATGLPGQLSLTQFSLYYSVAGGPMNYDVGYLRVRAVLPNGLPANFYLDCYK